MTGWELATGKKLGEYTEASGFGAGFIAATADNKSVVAVPPKGGVVVIDCTTGKKVRELGSGGEGQPSAPLVVSPDGKTAAILLGSASGQTRRARWCWSISTRARRSRRWRGYRATPRWRSSRPDGKTLVTGSQDTTALVWDVGK